MSDEPNEDDLRKHREVTAKAVAAARAVIRKHIDEIDKAAREGRLDEYCDAVIEDMHRRGREAELN
jgi:hypothetical protein